MLGFRILLVAILAIVVGYTIVVIGNHGMGLFPIFFGDILAMGWPGQFNLDFLGFLVLSGTWMAWRNNFSGVGLALGLAAPFGGVPLLTVYLLYLS
ncbi:MAG: hypothetical protein AAF993_04790, partial [Pseudomonadota bacterium]